MKITCHEYITGKKTLALMLKKIPFHFCESGGVSEAFGKGIAVNLQLCYLKEINAKNGHTYVEENKWQ